MRGGRGEALLHGRQQRLAAGEQLGVLVGEIGERAGDAGGMMIGRRRTWRNLLEGGRRSGGPRAAAAS